MSSSSSNGTGTSSSPQGKRGLQMNSHAPARLAVPSGSAASASGQPMGMSIMSPLKMSPPSLIMSADRSNSNGHGSSNEDTETNFFKALTENLRYSTNSPIPHTQFPTPYSSNQDSQGRTKGMRRNMGVISETQQQNSMDSSVLENSINTGFYSGIPSVASGNTGRSVHGASSRGSRNSNSSGSSLDTTEPTVDLLQNNNNSNDEEPLEDMNLQPSSVLQFGNTFSNEFLLASPEQLKEFLFESPAGFNLFHKTPAKTPLRFVTDSKDMNINLTSTSKSNSNLIHLFNSVNNTANDAAGESQVTNADAAGASAAADDMAAGMPDNFLSRTPLGKIDINLMFNQSGGPLGNSVSPSKKLSMSLTPYGRRVMNEMGTPFTRGVNYSNSALVDFQRARKDTNSATSQQHQQSTATPDKARPSKKRVLKNKQSLSPLGHNGVGKLTHVNLSKNRGKGSRMFNNENIQQLHAEAGAQPVLTKYSLYSKAGQDSPHCHDDEFRPDFDRDADVYGSSPTTIQLNSSVTKSVSRLDNNRIPNLQNMDLIDEKLGDKLFDMDGRVRIPLSPTPKSYVGSNTLNIGTLKIPELPKMGSFKSDAREGNEPNTELAQAQSQSNNAATDFAKIKRVRKLKPKKPKFQVFVSSINKFNEPSSFVPMSPRGKKQGKQAPAKNAKASSGKNASLKRSQSVLVKNSAKTAQKPSGAVTQPKVKRSASMSGDTNTFYNMY